MHSIESRFVIGPSNILFGGVYVCTFSPGNFTGWGSEGVNNDARVFYCMPCIRHSSKAEHICCAAPSISVIQGTEHFDCDLLTLDWPSDKTTYFG